METNSKMKGEIIGKKLVRRAIPERSLTEVFELTISVPATPHEIGKIKIGTECYINYNVKE